MPSPPRTVLDGLEGMWEGAVEDWRRANRRREEIEAANARAQRQVVDAASRGVQRVANGVRAGVDKAMARAGETQPGKVVDALFGTTKSPGGRQTGRIDYAAVAQRQARTAADVSGGLKMAARDGVAEAAWPLAATKWVNRVREKGVWDDKAHHPSGEWETYERQGNFAYGATAAELGLPEQVALRGAGLAQRLGNLKRALSGEGLAFSEGWLGAPYGDDPRDQLSISEGYRYGRTHPAGRRP